MEIYLEDLREDIQKEVLNFYNYSSETDGNLDIIPLFVLEKI